MSRALLPYRADSQTTSIVATVLPVAAAFALWFVRYPYDYGYGDQDEFLPYLLHLLDDGLFRADWFVQTQLQKIGVRTYFVFMLRVFCLVITPKVAVSLVFGTCWTAIALGITQITKRMGGSSVAVFLAVVGLMCLTPKWTLGGNDLVYTMLVPEMIAWVFVLVALTQFARRSFVLTGVLLGVAAWFQLLAGILTAGLLGLVLILARPGTASVKRAVVLCVAAIFASLPMLIPVATQQFLSGGAPAVFPSNLFVLSEFRAPHHYLPSAFSPGSWVRFGVLVAVGAPSAWWVAKNRHGGTLDLPSGTILATILGMCLLSWLFTEVVPVDFIVKLQVFKLTVLAKVLLVVAIAIVAEAGFVHLGALTCDSIDRATVLTSVSVLIVAGGLLFGGYRAAEEVARRNSWRAESVETWARESTPLDAVFVLPPSNSSFRTFARRAIVVNYAAVPFAPGDMAVWYERLQAIAPVQTRYPSRRLVQQLDSAFNSIEAGEWIRLADTYGIDYLVRRSGSDTRLPFEVAFRDGGWVAYRIGTATLAGSDRPGQRQ